MLAERIRQRGSEIALWLDDDVVEAEPGSHGGQFLAQLAGDGHVIGAFFGAKIMISLPPSAIKRVYAVFLILIAGKWLFTGK